MYGDGWEDATAYHDGQALVSSGRAVVFVPMPDGLGRCNLAPLWECHPVAQQWFLTPDRIERARTHVAFAVAAVGELATFVGEESE